MNVKVVSKISSRNINFNNTVITSHLSDIGQRSIATDVNTIAFMEYENSIVCCAIMNENR